MFDARSPGIEYDVRRAYLDSKRAFDERLGLALSRRVDEVRSSPEARTKWAEEARQYLDQLADAFQQMEPLAKTLAEETRYGLDRRKGYMWEVTERRMRFIKLAADVGYRNPMFL